VHTSVACAFSGQVGFAGLLKQTAIGTGAGYLQRASLDRPGPAYSPLAVRVRPPEM
jgi:hypothetical protein